MEKLRRPDTRTLRAAVALAEQLEEKFQQICASERLHKRAVQEAAQGLYQRRLREALEKMDVEHINNGKQGLRVGLLRSAGVENVWQASQLSFRQICDIDGLGEQSAQRIREVIEGILRNTKDTMSLGIRLEDPTEADDALLRALYIRIHARPLREQAQALLRRERKPLQQELTLARKALSGLGWLFRSREEKQRILQGVENLRLRLEGDLGNGRLTAAWEAVENPSPETCRGDYRENAPIYYGELEGLGLDWEKKETSGGLPAQLAARIQARPLDLRHLNATLRSYQTFGVQYILHQKKTLLGDEMGLGKTVQAIAAMAALAAEDKHHFMVVCPAGVLINWCREIRKFSSLEVTKVHGRDDRALLSWRENGGVAVTTYESISRFTLPEKFPIAMMVADEAHYVKNPDTLRTKALQKLLRQTEHILFMSGTPLENRVEELCFLVSCLQPELARELEAVKFLSTAQQFRLQLAPVYLRRTRGEVLRELPELIEKEQWCDLGPVEQEAYRQAVLSENFMAIRQVSWQVEDLQESAKARRLVELCDQAAEQGRKVIVFSFFRTTLEKVARLLGDRCLEPITGSVSPQRRQELVDAFGKAPQGAVLASQVQAGGTGLNIQSASVIVFCEPQIKPSIENQAISRAYRMGQVRDVLVYRLLAEDTVDERILELLKTKQLHFDSFADESVVGEESLKSSQSHWINRMVEEEKQRLLPPSSHPPAQP